MNAVTVHFQEITNPDSNMEVGIKGRGKRDQDSQDLKIVHVELTN